MHPFHLLTFAAVGFTVFGIVGSIVALLWSLRHPESWGPVLLATTGCMLMLPLGILMGLAAMTNGLAAESRSVAVAWVAGIVFASAVWMTALLRIHQSS